MSDKQYACFKHQDQTPIKVIVEDILNLYITWNKY